MNLKKVLSVPLSLSLLATGVSSVYAKTPVNSEKVVSESNNISPSHFSFEDNGERYDVKTAETKNERITTIKGKKGFQKFTTNKFNGNISVDSDYLKGENLKETEKMVNEMSGKISTFTPNTVIANSITGSYAWSSWQNTTVTVSDKATLSICTAAILSRIPYIGWVASAMASILINYQMQTGYFRVRAGTALDTNPDYVWVKKVVNLYTNSARTTLISSKTSSPWQVRVY